MADEKSFDLKIITPTRVFYEGKASMLEFTTTEGDMGIYKDHIPLTAVLVPCGVTITTEEGKKLAAVHSGFIQILKESVTMLAEVAEWPMEIDEKRAEEAKIRAERRLAAKDSKLNYTRAEMALRRALVRLEVKQRK